MEIRLALVDDHELFRAALGRSLREYGFRVVVEGGNARDTFPLIDKENPELALLDLSMPDMDGLTALRELRSRRRGLKVVMLTSSNNPHDVRAAWFSGAQGYMTKTLSLEMLVEGLREVVAGKRYLQPGLTVPDESAPPEGPLQVLSARERDVFRLIVGGLTSEDIARQLCISVKTVRTHRDRIMSKLDVHSAVQLVRFAVANDLLGAQRL